jgi:hypothetical protein
VQAVVEKSDKKSASVVSGEPTKSMVSKVRRAYRKAGIVPTDEVVLAFANSLMAANVNNLKKSSNRIARVINDDSSKGATRLGLPPFCRV